MKASTESGAGPVSNCDHLLKIYTDLDSQKSLKLFQFFEIYGSNNLTLSLLQSKNMR